MVFKEIGPKGSISGHTRVFGLLGHPVRHSLSPGMHTALFERLGLDAVYVAFDVDPRKAPDVASAIRVLDLVGVNLTVPFKELIIPDLDHVTVAAREAGAVNVVTNVDGVLVGYNTDGEGLLLALREEHDYVPSGGAVAILGAGGAARAVAASLASAGAERVLLFNRTLSRAEAACAHLTEAVGGCRFEPHPLAADRFDALASDVELVVNCLGGGAEELVEGLPIDGLPQHAIWTDINYWMESPPRLEECAARGLRTSDGLGMLIHQGALSFELFTGHPIEPSELRQIVAIAQSNSSDDPVEYAP